MNFSTNQVMQFYVTDASVADRISENITNRGFSIQIDDDHRSDIIENVMWVKAVSADAYATPTMQVELKLDSSAFDTETSAPVVGEEYVVRVSYPEVAGLGVEGWTTKTAIVTASKGETEDSLIEKLTKQLTNVLAVDDVLTVDKGTKSVIVKVNTDSLIKSYDRGRFPLVVPTFNVTTSVITLDGEYVIPFVVNEDTKQFEVTEGAVIPGVYKLAEMEYFAMGERGDQYRKMGWPDYVPTEYKVNTTDSYDVVHVHYAYKGDNASSYKSEKDLILVLPEGSAEDVASAIATKAGVTYVSVPKAE